MWAWALAPCLLGEVLAAGGGRAQRWADREGAGRGLGATSRRPRRYKRASSISAPTRYSLQSTRTTALPRCLASLVMARAGLCARLGVAEVAGAIWAGDAPGDIG